MSSPSSSSSEEKHVDIVVDAPQQEHEHEQYLQGGYLNDLLDQVNIAMNALQKDLNSGSSTNTNTNIGGIVADNTGTNAVNIEGT